VVVKALPMPDFYKSPDAQDASHYVRDPWAIQQSAMAYRLRHQLKPVGGDAVKIHLLVIDQQLDFSHPEGTLFVAGPSGTGAMDDQARLVEFIYRNLGVISEITCTMDSHLPYQVFYPSAHLRDDGTHPEPYTAITADEYRRGVYRPNPAMATQIGATPGWLQRQFTDYCEKLEQAGKYTLMLWPYHCVIGSGGHRLSGVVDEARLFHAFARGAKNQPEIKGGNPLTEHYSIFQPEVMTLFDGNPIPGVQRNVRLIETLLNVDMVVMSGEAASHCFAWSVDDLLNEILAKDPELAKKFYILEDCTSPVVTPVLDFSKEAREALDRFQNAGMHLVKSTDPIDSWPGYPG
jgi:nicotinamidase-related amidase